MRLFGKGTAAAKSGRVIYPNNPAISARKAPKNGLTIVGPSTSGMQQPPIIAMSDNPP